MIRFVCVFLLLVPVIGVASESNVAVRFQQDDGVGVVYRAVPAGMSAEEAAARAFIAGPHSDEVAYGFATPVPSGTQVVSFNLTDGNLTLDLSNQILDGLDDASLGEIASLIGVTMGSFPSVSNIRLTCNGNLLSSYLAPSATPPALGAPPKSNVSLAAVGLAGRNITINPSHGRYWNGSSWNYQRSDPCGFGEAVLEDTNSIRLMQFLNQYLTQDGATVYPARELNESVTGGPNGENWWKISAYAYLRHIGAPCNSNLGGGIYGVWGSSTGICNTDAGASTRLNDDIRSRPLYSDYRGSDISLACHTNAGGGGAATGTEVYYDTAMDHPGAGNINETKSQQLALAAKTAIESAIRQVYDASWPSRNSGQPRDGAGNYGEIRIQNRPGILVELAFHDNCSKDAQYLTDNFFRSTAEWGLYKGVCDYFGVSPTWDKYSDELVSENIPTNMVVGQVYNVSLTFRNRGVVWSSARGFQLGAVGGSDPFTGTTRINVGSETKPGQTTTFNFSLTAPGSPGQYTTDWQIVRELGASDAWFGPVVSKTVTVTGSPDSTPPSTPTGLNGSPNGPTSVQLSWTASTDNVAVTQYEIRRGGNIVGTSATTSYTDSSAVAGSENIYDVRAKDAAGNASGWSVPKSVITPPAPVAVFTDGFDSNLNNWTQSGNPFTYSTTLNHGSLPGAGAAFCAVGESDQMAHTFDRPFAQATVSGWFWDSAGGFKTGVCGGGYRQALSLREPTTGAGMIIDNGISQNASTNYTYRTVGTGGSGTAVAYATRNPNANCSGDWIYYKTDVTPTMPGSGPTGTATVLVTDGAGTTSANIPLQTSFFSYGIGRITLGLGVSSTGLDSYWDDIVFLATPPGAPTMSAPAPVSQSQIQWSFAPTDANLFGFDVADSGGGIVSASYPNAGWLNRGSVSWTESGLSANTSYTRKVRAWNGTLNGVYSATASATTLSVPPSNLTVTCNRNTGTWYATAAFVFQATGGFGPGTVDHYAYAWNQSPTHTFDGTEAVWNTGNLSLNANSAGVWYLHIKGFNSAGAANGELNLGDYRFAQAVSRISDALATADGVGISLSSKSVTGQVGNRIWIEETDRSLGLELQATGSFVPDDVVTVAGELSLIGPRRVLVAGDIQKTGVGSTINPMHIVHRDLACSAFNGLTPGATGGVSLYNSALLTRGAGIVTYSDSSSPNDKYFYYDDGSGLADGSGRTGIKVLCGSIDPPVSGFVIVTGLSSLETSLNGVSPVIVIRSVSDLQ